MQSHSRVHVTCAHDRAIFFFFFPHVEYRFGGLGKQCSKEISL